MHSATATPLRLNSPNVKQSLELLKFAQTTTTKKTIMLNSAEKSHSYAHPSVYNKNEGYSHRKSG